MPDANTIWTFREALTRANLDGRPAIEVLFGAYEAALTRAGFLAMGGQIVDASIIAALKQRNTDAEKRDLKEGRIPAAWADKPAKLAQKDRDARWTVKWSKAKPAEDGSPRVDLAVATRTMCGRPLRCKKNLLTGAARDRVLPCVRPPMRHDHGRGPVWEFEDQVHITSARSRRCVLTWFS